MSSSELFSRIIAGDEKALEELYNKYSASIYRIAYRYTGNHEDAEEITSDVFVKIWQKARSFKGESSISTWIYRITVNTALDYRKKNRKGTTPLEENIQLSIEKGNDSTIAKIIHLALNNLPAAQKMAVILTQIEGYSYAETAKLMGKSVKSVESLVHRGKTKLKKLLLPILNKNNELDV